MRNSTSTVKKRSARTKSAIVVVKMWDQKLWLRPQSKFSVSETPREARATHPQRKRTANQQDRLLPLTGPMAPITLKACLQASSTSMKETWGACTTQGNRYPQDLCWFSHYLDYFVFFSFDFCEVSVSVTSLKCRNKASIMNSLCYLISSVVHLVPLVHTCMPKEWPWIPTSLTRLTFPGMETLVWAACPTTLTCRYTDPTAPF